MPFETIHNYYERVVFRAVQDATRELAAASGTAVDADVIADMACVALNRLPARYIRHDIDLAYYLTDAERETMDQMIKAAVTFAVDFVQQRARVF
ncbi:MAG: late competence development ComFB family protein [Gammaproteobacteria bacterium]|nr:late competence development ComFB family protein [Gammaproteobacteria bacterium]